MSFPIIALTLVMLIACLSDLRSWRIPNWLTLSGAVTGLCYHSAMTGLQGFAFSAGGCLLGIFLLIVFYLMGGMGAGDVKLMGTAGALLGPQGVLAACLFTAMIGGLQALFVLVRCGRIRDLYGRYRSALTVFSSLGNLNGSLSGGSENLPHLHYGFSIALGSLLSTLIPI